ncbi:hypothetical protein LINGRAHAP2_LOCUS19527 [Linum grandiflorum]
MSMRVFGKLCKDLVHVGGLKKTNNVEVDEMVVMFLHTLGHNVKNRILQQIFGRSGKTICAVIHAVLVSNMHETLYKKAEPITENSGHAFWQHFKNCLGALDGTHVKVRTKIEDQPRYRNRKGEVTMNVLGVCNPYMEFIYVLSGWEGSTHDGRVLRDDVSRPNGLKVPKAMPRKRKEETTEDKERSYFSWNNELDKLLVSSMKGKFVPGAYLLLEDMMERAKPGCGVKADPNIMSRVKTIKQKFLAI